MATRYAAGQMQTAERQRGQPVGRDADPAHTRADQRNADADGGIAGGDSLGGEHDHYEDGDLAP